MMGWRLQSGGRIVDRSRPISFSWAGRTLSGFSGDTLASALLANGVSVVGRSFKYHRPRGLLAAGVEEPNGVVQLEDGAHTIPNVKATLIELYDGLRASPVNAWPSVEFDALALNNVVKRFIPAAFYYKTFMWPHWRLFEPAIRCAAGLGKAPSEPDPDIYEHAYAHCETLVIGSGAAGLAAAVAASTRGEDVLLVEMEATLGGDLLTTSSTVERRPAEAWRADALARLSHARVMTRTMAFGYYDDDLVGLLERVTDHVPLSARHGPRQRLIKVRCGRVIIATGAIERPLSFVDNDRPGVMLASAAQTYAARYGVAVGKRVVIATNNDSAYATAAALRAAGVEVPAVLDTRRAPPRVTEAIGAFDFDVRCGVAPIKAKGGSQVRGVVIGPVDGGASETIACDALLTSAGWGPTVHLHSQAGGRLTFDPAIQAFAPSEMHQNAVCVGAAAGFFSYEMAVEQARAVAERRAFASPRLTQSIGPLRAYADGEDDAAKAWIDFQNDVTVGDLQLAVRENFRSVEHVKRYTTLGMASDQGKTSNVSGIGVVAGLLGVPPGSVGTTKFRPPFDPVTIGAFAGRAVAEDLLPIAHTPSEESGRALGGAYENYGGWRRAAFFARPGETETEAVTREVKTVRERAGVFDASPLGKIEVKGPDAAEFLDRIYINKVKTLKIGQCRYGLILNENGSIFDDGILARTADDHFLVGTTSGHARAVADMLEEWLQCEWPHLRVLVENVTTGWAVMTIAGPKAREILSSLNVDFDLSPQLFPHMAYREGHVAGAPARVQRVSFCGELSYEVAVPWRYGAALWSALLEAGHEHDIAPFGVEALMTMRIEKGFLHVGSDTDGATVPEDVGFGGIIAAKKGDFVGRRSTMRPDALRSDRRQLVGLEVSDGGPALNPGAHVLPPRATAPRGTDGWVTSSTQSPTLGRPVALALVRAGRSRMGEAVRVWDLGVWRTARIADPKFFDPDGVRLDA